MEKTTQALANARKVYEEAIAQAGKAYEAWVEARTMAEQEEEARKDKWYAESLDGEAGGCDGSD